MRKTKLMITLAMLMITSVVSAQGVDISPFCTTCELENIDADVYIVLPADIAGQLISGQFRRVMDLEGKKDAPIAMSVEEVTAFIESDGFNHLKQYGDVYATVLLNKKYFLMEIKKIGNSYEPLQVQSYYKVVSDDLTPFLQLIIPRQKKNI